MSEKPADVVVIGAGPAGMVAAIAASNAGARVALIDEGFAPGGQIWRDKLGTAPHGAPAEWKSRLASSRVDRLASTSVVDVHRAGETFTVTAERISDGQTFHIAARALVVATGARERFVPFPGWTLANVVGVGGAQALLKNGLSVRGRRVVVAGSGPLLLPVAASLTSAGANLVLVAEQTGFPAIARFSLSLWRTPSMLVQAAQLRAAFRRTRYAFGTWVTRAVGDERVESVTVTDGNRSRDVECDLLCTAFGLVPNTELARLLGCETRPLGVVVNEFQSTSVPGVYCAGEPTGIGGVDLSLIEGEIAGLAAAGAPIPASLRSRRTRLKGYSARLEQSFALRPEIRSLATAETIVCRCEDVRLADLDRSWTTRQAKLYTRAGMGACQGRICGAALECVMGWAPDSVRPPIQPARLTTLLADPRASDFHTGAP
ncbi:MAG TPA: FAD-dependent oxidoreductase [Gemmatimonadaceae bacterium]